MIPSIIEEYKRFATWPIASPATIEVGKAIAAAIPIFEAIRVDAASVIATLIPITKAKIKVNVKFVTVTLASASGPLNSALCKAKARIPPTIPPPVSVRIAIPPEFFCFAPGALAPTSRTMVICLSRSICSTILVTSGLSN